MNQFNQRRMKSTGESSRMYGPCEVCFAHAPEVFHLSFRGKYLFGHQECLRNVRSEEISDLKNTATQALHGGVK